VTATACPTCGTRIDLLDSRAGFSRVCPRCLLAGVVKDLGDAIAPSKGVLTGRTLGNYEVLGLLGSGGMGAVYRAKQRGLDRQVALKVLATPGGEKEIERFFREARALARLRHPNIVAVHEVASDAGFYFYTMDLVAGYTLADEIARGPVTPKRAARTLATVARAVHHAHENGIVHRDLKPTNILLGEGGQTMVADFGLALDLQASQITRSGQPLGTAPYMAPEQAAGRHAEVDARTDVWALGAVLYECLAGRAPFDAESLWDVLRKVQFDEPAPLPAGAPCDLAAVCLKALAKRREDRYANAEALARDLERFLDGRPVSARLPAGRVGRAARTALAALGILVACTAIAAVIAYAIAREDGPVAPKASAFTLSDGDRGEVYDVAFAPDGRLASCYVSGAVLLWDVEKRSATELVARGPSQYRLDFSRDGALAMGGWKSTLRIWNGTMRTLAEPSEAAWAVAYSPDGRRLAVGTHGGKVRVWEGGENVPLATSFRLVHDVAWSPDGRTLVACGADAKSIAVWDAAEWKERRALEGHRATIRSLDFAPDGTLLSASEDGEVWRWNVRADAISILARVPGVEIDRVVVHPGGRMFATTGSDARVRLWTIGDPVPVAVLGEHGKETTGAAFSRDGRWLATASRDGTVRVWSLQK